MRMGGIRKRGGKTSRAGDCRERMGRGSNPEWMKRRRIVGGLKMGRWTLWVESGGSMGLRNEGGEGWKITGRMGLWVRKWRVRGEGRG